MIVLLIAGLLFFLVFRLQEKIYLNFWSKNLTVDIHFSREYIVEGEECSLKEVIENRKRLPLPMLKVKFRTDRRLIFGDSVKGARITDQFYRNDVFRVGGGEKITRVLKFIGSKRGFYELDSVSLVASDLFLNSEMVGELPLHGEIYVYPRPYDSREMRQSLTWLNGEVLSRRHLLEDPFEYRGIREYQPYDDMRRINWKATAKTGELKVNERNYTSLKSVHIFFNIQDDGILKKEDCVEMSLRIAASLCAFFLRQGLQVSCCGNGLDIMTHQPVAIDAKGGQSQMDAVYRALARVDTEQPAADFAEAFEERIFKESGGAFTCFVAPNQYEDFVELLTKYRETGRPFMWFYPVQSGQYSEEQKPELPAALTKHITVVYFE